MTRKLGINVGAVANMLPCDALELMREAGFEAFFTGSNVPEDVRAMKEKGESLGMTLDFLHAPFKEINTMWYAGADYIRVFNNMKQSIDAAADNNIPAVVIHVSTDWVPPQVNDRGFARYDELVNHAGERGVQIAFENLRRIGNLACIAERYEKVPHVGFCYDTGHEHGYTAPFQWMDLFKKKTLLTHIHDNMGPCDPSEGTPDYHWLPFDGTCDFRRVMSKLDQYGYTGTLMLEVSQKKKPEYLEMSPQDFLKTAFERIQTISGYSTL